MTPVTDYPMTMAVRTLRTAKVPFTAYKYDFVPHGGTRQAASELGLDHHATVKTIVLEDETRKPFVCLMHGDCEISTKNLARTRGCKTVTPCEPETADRHSGYHVGGTSPFGTRRRMTVYVQESLFDLPKIYINLGHRGLLCEMNPADLEKALPGLVQRVRVDIVKDGK